jgi:hypothetical protein
MAEIIHLPPIDKPTEEQVRYFLMKAAFYDEVCEHGGIGAEQAAQERRQALARISMGRFPDQGDAA